MSDLLTPQERLLSVILDLQARVDALSEMCFLLGERQGAGREEMQAGLEIGTAAFWQRRLELIESEDSSLAAKMGEARHQGGIDPAVVDLLEQIRKKREKES